MNGKGGDLLDSMFCIPKLYPQRFLLSFIKEQSGHVHYDIILLRMRIAEAYIRHSE